MRSRHRSPARTLFLKHTGILDKHDTRRRWWSSGLWHRMALQTSPWRWRPYVSSKRWKPRRHNLDHHQATSLPPWQPQMSRHQAAENKMICNSTPQREVNAMVRVTYTTTGCCGRVCMVLDQLQLRTASLILDRQHQTVSAAEPTSLLWICVLRAIYTSAYIGYDLLSMPWTLVQSILNSCPVLWERWSTLLWKYTRKWLLCQLFTSWHC
jgi:hypothetical protein